MSSGGFTIALRIFDRLVLEEWLNDSAPQPGATRC